MKLVRTLFLLATGMAIAGFVQAESASIYMHIKKGGRHHHRPQAVTAEQADAGHVVIRSNPEIAIANVVTAANQAKTEQAAKTVTPEEQPLDTILPANSRIVQGDDTKDEFYILAEGEQEPVKPIEVSLRQHQMAVDTQLKRVDTKGSMWAISKPAHVDAILSQIAHKATVSEQHQQLASAQKTTVAKPLFQAEKNGDVADIEVALDKVFAEVDANNAMPAVLPIQQAQQQAPASAVKLAAKKQTAKRHQSGSVTKLAVKKHTTQRLLSQQAPVKQMKPAAKKLTQNKIKGKQRVSLKHQSKQRLAASHKKKPIATTAKKVRKMQQTVMKKPQHKMLAVNKPRHHIRSKPVQHKLTLKKAARVKTVAVIKHPIKKRVAWKKTQHHLAMIREHHVMTRRHAVIHVHA